MQITVEELNKRLKSGANLKIIDVRQPDEFEICSLPNAALIPLRELPQRLKELDSKDEIIVYCHHGWRSMQAAAFLRQKGFKNTFNLAGGIDTWSCKIDPAVKRY